MARRAAEAVEEAVRRSPLEEAGLLPTVPPRWSFGISAAWERSTVQTNSVFEGTTLAYTPVMVTDRNLYARTITDVVDHYGYTQLALYLNVSIDDLDRWVAGEDRPSTDVFLRILELKSEVTA